MAERESDVRVALEAVVLGDLCTGDPVLASRWTVAVETADLGPGVLAEREVARGLLIAVTGVAGLDLHPRGASAQPFDEVLLAAGRRVSFTAGVARDATLRVERGQLLVDRAVELGERGRVAACAVGLRQSRHRGQPP